MLLLLRDFYHENETFDIYLKYDYLSTSDTVTILKSLEVLHNDILKSIGLFNVRYKSDYISFTLTIDEIHTGNSVNIKFGKKWIKRKKVKKTDSEVENQFEISISFGLKEVIACLLVFGVINSPRDNINSWSENDRQKFEVIQDSLEYNRIWNQLRVAPKETYLNIEKKARDLTYFFIQNPTFKEVVIDGICIKRDEQDNLK